MIQALIDASLKHRLLVVVGTLILIALGLRALDQTPVDALPDLSENQVTVYADWPGRSPQEVEDQLTHPLAASLQGLAGIQTVRASSMFGFALVTAVFADGLDRDLARQRVLERLNFLAGELPAGVAAKLAPDATGLGWVYQYYLVVDPARTARGDGYDLGQLRSLQDWFIRTELRAVPGVADVGSVGGMVQAYQIEVDSQKMRAGGVSLGDVMTAVGAANLNVGGKTIEENGTEWVVRGVGLVRNGAELEQALLRENNGVPVCLKDVARVELGGEFRRGTLDVDGQEVVGGTVVMRTGENAREVIARVKAKISALSASLPPGVSIRSFYDRSELIDRTVGTLKHALLTEIMLVVVVQLVFLCHWRSLLIVTLPLPVSILFAFLLMRHCGVNSNLMSLAGIAIAIGVLVDAAIVMTENAIRQCALAEQTKGGALSSSERLHRIRSALRQVGRPVGFALGIILLAFAPVFALTGMEGKLFHPLAWTKTLAMLGALLLALTLVPVLCTWLVRGPFVTEERNPVMRCLLGWYEPVLDFALHHRRAVVLTAALVCVTAVALVPRMGSEFMPPLNEGSLLYMPSFLPAASLSEVKRAMTWQDQVIKSFPEVRSAAGKLGRADTATDPAPTEMIETTIQLKPERAWRPGMTREKLVAEMSAALRRLPGSVPGFLQPIQGRVLMISTGIRAQLGVKILGDDPVALQRAARAVQGVVETVPGADGVTPSRVLGKPWLEVRVDRDALVRYGMRVQDVMEVVEAGLGGREVTTAIGGRVHYPVQVRLQRSEREDLERLREVLVTSPAGRVMPLGQLAAIERVTGPNEIASENGRLRAYVQANASGRSLGGFVQEVKDRLNREVAPRLAASGMTLEYCGEYESQRHAERTLAWIIPVVVLIIFLLLHQLYGTVRDAALVICALPFALSGAIILQYFLGWPFSVAVLVGYLALLGTAVQTAVVMVLYLEEAVQRQRQELGQDLSHAELLTAIKAGARLRLRPKVMTVATVVASLLPILWSHGTGAEIMQPIAVPVLGGMVTSLALILIVTPVMFLWVRELGLAKIKP